MNSYPSKISPIQITGHRRNEAQTNTSTPWLKYAEGEIGQVEFDPGDNPRITKYLLSTGVKGREITPWCAAYVNWSLQQAGIKGTNSASSLSYDDSNWGNKLSQPALGSIASIKTL